MYCSTEIALHAQSLLHMSIHYILVRDAMKVFFVSDLPNSSDRTDPEFNPACNIQHTCTFLQDWPFLCYE